MYLPKYIISWALICKLQNRKKNEWNSDSFSQQRILRNACAKNHLCRYPRIATAPSPSARTLYYYIAGAPNTTHNRVPQNLAAGFFPLFFCISSGWAASTIFLCVIRLGSKSGIEVAGGKNSNMSFCMRHCALGGARRQQLAQAQRSRNWVDMTAKDFRNQLKSAKTIKCGKGG